MQWLQVIKQKDNISMETQKYTAMINIFTTALKNWSPRFATKPRSNPFRLPEQSHEHTL
jgi:hypothetical protein